MQRQPTRKYMTPEEMAVRVRQLWDKLRSAVKSGMAGWLAKHASEASHDKVEAISVREVVFPKFSVGDTLALPSNIIPFVAAARFLRSYLSTHSDDGDDRRRTVACRLVLSQHGIATLMSAFWYVVLRRFRWCVTEPGATNNNTGGGGDLGDAMGMSATMSGSILNASNSMQQQQSGSPASTLSRTQIAPAGFARVPSAAQRRATSAGGAGSVNGGGMGTPAASVASMRSVLSSSFNRAASALVSAEALQYAQGLLFNATFHFSQIYAHHGTEIRSAATLQLFCQLFAATLLNFLKSEFWDAADEVVMSPADAQKRREMRKSPDKEGAGRQERSRYISTTSNDENSIEEYVNAMSVSWFFGDGVGAALSAAFSNSRVASDGKKAAAAGPGNQQSSQHSSQQQQAINNNGGHLSPFSVPARHQLDGFIKSAKAMESALAASGPTTEDNNTVDMPLKLECRRNHELLAQQLRNRQQQLKMQQRAAAKDKSSGGGNNSNINNDDDEPILSSLDQIRQQQQQQQQALGAGTGIFKRARASEVTENMETLVHTKDGRSSIKRDDSGAKKRAAFFEANNKHLEYCRARLTVQGVSVDEIGRGIPFPLGTRSQLLQLGQVLADHHIATLTDHGGESNSMFSSNNNASFTLNGNNQTLGSFSGFFPSPGAASRAAAAQTTTAPGTPLSASMSPGGGGGTPLFYSAIAAGIPPTPSGMTNAFTPRPEASLQLNAKDAARRAGMDSSRRPTRCPFCHPHPHTLALNITAMKHSRQAQKAAAKCRSCFEAKGGWLPMMTCTRCNAALCVDCIKVHDVPVVETVLAKAAMAAATRSFTSVVAKLWGQEIAGTVFGPVAPPETRARLGATLADLGEALTPTLTLRKDSRPGSAAVLHGADASIALMNRSRRGSSATPTPGGGNFVDSPSTRVSRAVTPLPRNPMQQQQQQGSSDGGVFNLTHTTVPSSPSVNNNSNNNTSLPRQRPDSSMSMLSSAAATTTNPRNNNSSTAPPRPGSAISCCSWMTPGHLQGRIMRTGGRIDDEVFTAEDPAEQHASLIGVNWRNRHLVRVTRIPDPSKGNLGRLRAHIARSLEHARETVDRAAADAELERAETAQQNRRLKEASSRDMIRQFRSEAEAASQRLSGGAVDEQFHKRRIASAIETYAARFAGSGSAVQNPKSIAAAHEMLDALANNPSLGLMSTAARKKIVQFIVHEKNSIGKAQLAASRLTDLLSWSQHKGDLIGADTTTTAAKSSSSKRLTPQQQQARLQQQRLQNPSSVRDLIEALEIELDFDEHPGLQSVFTAEELEQLRREREAKLEEEERQRQLQAGGKKKPLPKFNWGNNKKSPPQQFRERPPVVPSPNEKKKPTDNNMPEEVDESDDEDAFEEEQERKRQLQQQEQQQQLEDAKKSKKQQHRPPPAPVIKDDSAFSVVSRQICKSIEAAL